MGSIYIGQQPFHSLDKVTFFKNVKKTNGELGLNVEYISRTGTFSAPPLYKCVTLFMIQVGLFVF